VAIATIAAVLAGTVGATLGPAAAATSCAGVKHAGHWDTIGLPSSSSYTPSNAAGGAALDTSTYPLTAVSRRTGDITVTDAARTGIWHSADGGCSWHSVFSLSQVSGSDGTWLNDMGYQFSSFAVAEGTGAHPLLYAAAVPFHGTGQDASIAIHAGTFGFGPDEVTLRLFMFVSRDGGATWKQTYTDSSLADVESDALHPACMNGSVVVNSASPSSVFVQCQRNSGDPTSALYASTDSAAHWATATAKNMPPTPYMPALGFGGGLGAGSTLWMPGNVTVQEDAKTWKPYVTIYRSMDRGATWKPTALRADKVCDVNTTGWVVSTAMSTPRGKTIAMWSAAAFLRSANGGTTWTRALPFTGGSGDNDYEGAAISGPADNTTYVVAAWPRKSADWGTNFRPWGNDLRAGHALLILDSRGKWRTVGTIPVPANTAFYEMQAGWWHGSAVYGLALTQNSTTKTAFAATLLRYRP
jgi:hypothetical protein